jgi:hypothetical protein
LNSIAQYAPSFTGKPSNVMAFERRLNYRFMNGSARVLDVEQWASNSLMMTRLIDYRYE